MIEINRKNFCEKGYSSTKIFSFQVFLQVCYGGIHRRKGDRGSSLHMAQRGWKCRWPPFRSSQKKQVAVKQCIFPSSDFKELPVKVLNRTGWFLTYFKVFFFLYEQCVAYRNIFKIWLWKLCLKIIWVFRVINRLLECM